MLTEHGNGYSWGDGKVHGGTYGKAKALRDGVGALGVQEFRKQTRNLAPYAVECAIAEFRGTMRDGTLDGDEDDINGGEMAYAGLSAEQRRRIPDSDFAGSGRSFPIENQDHLNAAVRLIGRAPASEQAEIKRRIIEIAHRKNLVLPQSWSKS